MRTLSIDIETYSPVDLRTCGVYAYAAHPEFEILLFGYAFDDDPVQVIDLASGEELSIELQNALYDPEILKTAFNAAFERTCLGAFMGSEMPPDQWSCTAVWARELGLPSSLEAVGVVLGLPEDKQKLKTGKALIRYFSVPCKPTKVNGQRTRNLPEHDPERWALYKEYNAGDVVDKQARAHAEEMFLSGYQFTSKAARNGILAELRAKDLKVEDGTIIGGKEFMQSLMDNEDYKGAFKAQESSGDGKGGDDGKGDNGGSNGGAGGQQSYQSTTGNIYTGQNKPKFSAGTNGGVETGGNAPKFNFGFTHIREPEKK